MAALLALALLAAPLRAVVVEMPRWSPLGDDALIELRARDTGTSRTPLVGQPSTSGAYGSDSVNVAHPGPLGFYVLTPGVRLLGATTGILLSTMLVTGASVLVAAWVVFRQAGPRAGAVGAVLLAGAMWAAGGAGLVDPLSSNFGRFALLAAAVLLWALACGDVRLLPLTVGFWSFAVQQHLSVLPAGAVVAAAAVVAVVVMAVRARSSGRTAMVSVLRWVAVAVGVGLVLWAPVIREELPPDRGNLTLLANYSGDPERVDLGLRSGVGQVVQAVGLPPFVARSSVTGGDLVEPPTPVGVGVALVVGALLLGGGWWARRREPRLTALVGCVVVLAGAGVLTGANVPDSLEQSRLNFFHWAFALSLLELLALAWLATLAVTAGRHRWQSSGVTAAGMRPATGPRSVLAYGVPAVALIAVAAVVPLGLDRRSDRLPMPVRRDVVERFVAQIEADPAVDQGGPLLTLVVGDEGLVQVTEAVRVRLLTAGHDVRFDPGLRGYVHPDHRLDPCDAERALILGLGVGAPRDDIPGRQIAAVEVAPELDGAAVDRLSAQAEGEQVILGPDLEGVFERMPGKTGTTMAVDFVFGFSEDPARFLQNQAFLDLVIDHPPVSPELDRADLISLRDSFPEGVDRVSYTDLTANLADRDQLRSLRPGLADCP